MLSKCQQGLIVATNADKSKVIYALMEPFHRHCQCFLFIYLFIQQCSFIRHWTEFELRLFFFLSGGGGRVGVDGGGEERCGNYSTWQRLTARPDVLKTWQTPRSAPSCSAVTSSAEQRNAKLPQKSFGCGACDAMQRSKRKQEGKCKTPGSSCRRSRSKKSEMK